MPRGTSVFSRAMTGLVTGALLITALHLSTSTATASEPAGGSPEASDFDAAAALESLREDLPVPDTAPSRAVPDRAVRADVREQAQSAPADEATADGSTRPDAQARDTGITASEAVADGATVRGTVTDSAGAPVEGVTVGLYGGDTYQSDGYYSVKTAADGTWEITGVDTTVTTWYVEFVDPQERFATQWWNGVSRYYQPTPIELTAGAVVDAIDATLYRPGRISGAIAGGHANWDEGAYYVEVYVYDSTYEEWYGVDWRQASADGAFDLQLSPDFYAIRAIYASDRGVGYALTEPMQLDEGAEISLELEVERLVVGPDRDFSGDWSTDVLAITSTGALRMYPSDGYGFEGGSSQIGSGWGGMNTVFYGGDFSGDGHTDVIARDGSGNLLLYRGNGKGGWAGSAKIGTGWGGFTSVFAPGDFDGDGNVDVMARDKAGALYLYRGNGAGGWLNRLTVGSGWQGFNTLIGAGDFYVDGNPDVIARDGFGRLYLFPGNGTGGWLGKRQIGSGWQNFTAVVGASNFYGPSWQTTVLARDADGRLRFYLGDGAGGWSGWGQGGHGWNGLRIVG